MKVFKMEDFHSVTNDFLLQDSQDIVAKYRAMNKQKRRKIQSKQLTIGVDGPYKKLKTLNISTTKMSNSEDDCTDPFNTVPENKYVTTQSDETNHSSEEIKEKKNREFTGFFFLEKAKQDLLESKNLI